MINFKSLRRTTSLFFVLLAITLVACSTGRPGGNSGDDDDSNNDLPNLPNNGASINDNVSVTMAGSGAGRNTGNNKPVGNDTYSGGGETDPGVLFVVNNSGLEIAELYITECDNYDDWGPNQLTGDYTLWDGGFIEIYGIPTGCYDFAAYDADDEVGWYYPGAEFTEENPEFSLILLPPEEPSGDDDDAADDDDDAVSDDDDEDTVIALWNKGTVDFGTVTAWEPDTEDSWLVCEWLAVGSVCNVHVDPGTYRFTGMNEDQWCWLETTEIDIQQGQMIEYWITPSDVMCK